MIDLRVFRGEFYSSSTEQRRTNGQLLDKEWALNCLREAFQEQIRCVFDEFDFFCQIFIKTYVVGAH